MLASAVRIALPDVCPACAGRPPGPTHELCDECWSRLTFISGRRCSSCGGVLDNALDVCGECLRCPARPWVHAVSVFVYGGLVREMIHRLKYGRQPHNARFLGSMMGRTWLAEGRRQVDLVVPVPLYWLRRTMRGFNQATLLAGLVSSEVGVPLFRALRRVRKTSQQARLGYEARQSNMDGVFALRKRIDVSGLRVLLIDDVYTTGATLTAAAGVLVDAGASEVCVLTAARG